jgi:hypothetical protein
LRLGIENFNRGNLSLAERYFQDATEKGPQGRFSLDRPCRQLRSARALRAGRPGLRFSDPSGPRNDRHSQQSRLFLHAPGRPGVARRAFLKAYEREPGKPTIANNLKLLDEGKRFITRSPDAL